MGVLVAVADAAIELGVLEGSVQCEPVDLHEVLEQAPWTLVVVPPSALPLPPGNYVVAAWLDTPEQAAAAVEAGADHVLHQPAPELVRALLPLARRERMRRDLMSAFETVCEHMSDGIEITDKNARIEIINAAHTQHSGYSLDEARGRTPGDLTRSTLHSAELFDEISNTLDAGEIWSGALVGERKDGGFVHQFTKIVPVLARGGHPVRFVALKTFFPWLSEDVPDDDLMRSVARLKWSELRHRAMIAAAGDSMIVADHETNVILDANAAALRLYGYDLEEFRGATTNLIIDDQATHDDVTRVAGGNLFRRMSFRRKDDTRFIGELRLVLTEVSGRKVRIGITRDVTEQLQRERELEESNRQLREAQQGLMRARLAAIGELAAGVAHEINNPLQFLSANLEVLGESIHGEHDDLVADALEGVRRIKSIVRALVPFARLGVDEMSSFDFNEVVRWACRVADNEIRHRAHVALRLGELPKIAGYEGKLGQLVTNLLVNAANAIDAGSADDNRIIITTSTTPTGIRLEVADSGSGIPDDARDRIFEPFFTTRREGTGLGLALCAEIVRAHEGTIHVSSSELGGAAFIVELPRGPQTEPHSRS